MGRIIEALERAEREFQKIDGGPAVDTKEKQWLTPVGPSNAQIVALKVVDLKTRLITRYSGQTVKSVLITATRPGSGASTTSVSLATALAKDSHLKVLLVDTNMRTPGLHEVFKTETTGGLYDLLYKDDVNLMKFKKVGPGELYLLTSGVSHPMEDNHFSPELFEKFIQRARESFDYIILDSAPINSYPDSQAICSKVDGVILVIEAGMTRRQVALRAKKELEDAGATIFGVVLNRRIYYIPNWIYKRL